MYTTLKEAYPSHGLEIVFVSSDRDEDSFNRYFNTMPWLAIPYGHLPLCKQYLSTKYNVRGIPSMVVVDSISGQIVINNNESRTLVMQTCQGGTDESICSMFSTHWLSKTPAESQQLLDLLATSNVEEGDSSVNMVLPTVELCSYLVRNEFAEQYNRVEQLAAQFLADDESDMDEVEAYKTANEVVLLEVSMDDRNEDIHEICLDGLFERIEIFDMATEGYPATLPGVIAEQIVRKDGREQLDSVLTTIRKYFDNCFLEPWNPKYRKFKLSFKVADGITRVDGSISLMKSMGFVIFCTTEDFVAYIPITIDLDEMKGSITSLCQQFNVATF
jgi:Thioredoxin-like/PUB domain